MTALRHASLGEMLSASAADYPEKVALICRNRRVTYRQLDQASDRTADAIVSAGHDQGHRIGILGKNSGAYIEILFGILKAGCTATVLNWRLAAPEMSAVASDAGLDLLFHDVEFSGLIEQLKPAFPVTLRLIAFDGTGTAATDYDAFRGSAHVGRQASISADGDAILMYTSGTTGAPKGVPATHFAMLWGVKGAQSNGPECGGIDADVNLLTTPLFHLAGLGWTFGALHSGASLVILPEISMPLIIAAIAEHRVTRAVILPALMPALLDGAAAGTDLSSLRLICYGASPIPEPLLARMLDRFKCGFLQNYGMTEISGSATFLGPADHYQGSPHLLSCGRPYPEVEIKVVGPDGRQCAPGETGEILLRTPSLFHGYRNQPEASRAVLVDGWYATGDMGALDEAGYIFLRDRKKDMIISGGENIYPAEVESAMAGHPDIIRAAVIGVPSAKWGEEVKAVVIGRPGSALTAEALITFLRPLIAGYKLPKSIDFVGELPLTPVGKVAKAALRERYWQGLDRRIN